MKTSSMVITITLILFFTTIAQAKIWRVNNNPNIKANFTTAQGAVDSSNAGDTIHLEPSANNYGDLNVTKRVVLIGVGNLLAENSGNQVKTLTAAVNTLTIKNANARGTVIMITVNGIIDVSDVNDITFTRCYVGRNFKLTNTNNILIKNCFTNDEGIPNRAISIRITNCTNTSVINNILRGAVTMDANSSAIIANNVLNRNNNTGGFGTEIPKIYNTQFINNIINRAQPITFDAASTIQYNFSSGSLPTTGNNTNNRTNVNMSTVFVNSSGATDKDFMLSAASIAIGAGLDGVDCGAFGGVTPYKLALQPPIPAIYKLEVPATVAGNTLHVTFSTKSNN